MVEDTFLYLFSAMVSLGCVVVSAVDVITFIVVPFFLVLAVLGLWLIQLLVIEAQRRFLFSLRRRHEPLLRFTNFIGILFQTLCQWLGYTVTNSGVSEFRLSINDGAVTPKRERTGVLKWVADCLLFLGPFLIPAGLLLLAGYFVIRGGYAIAAAGFTIQGQAASFGAALVGFAQSFVAFLGHLDLFNPLQLGFLVLLLFCGLGIRPSYRGERHKEHVTFSSDLGNIKGLFLDQPRYLIGVFVVIYVIAAASFIAGAPWFLDVVTIFAWVALLAILALLLTFILLVFLRTLDEIKVRYRVFPFLSMILAYVGFRLLFFVVPVENAEGASLFGMLGVTLAVTICLLKWKTSPHRAAAC